MGIKKTEGQKAVEAESKKDPKRSHIRAKLKELFPFLRKKYRTIKESEVNSEDVFDELFPKEKKSTIFTKRYKLKALYDFQR